MRNELHTAVLIDADNVSHSYVGEVMEKARNYGDGIITIKRIYGDWTKPTMAGWKSQLMKYAIHPIQQYSYTTGKNATDFALVIDAIDMLYQRDIDVFFIVSSDSDYTRLVMRLKESGKIVIGMGKEQTPESLVAACNDFVFIRGNKGTEPTVDNGVKMESMNTSIAQVKVKPTKQVPSVPLPSGISSEVLTLIRDAVMEASGSDGWVELSCLASTLSRKRPGFDSKFYGYSKFKKLIVACQGFFLIDEKHVLEKKSKKKKFFCVKLRCF